MLRGDVFLADPSPTVAEEIRGTRPVVIVSRDAINRSSPVVIVVPITDRRNKPRIYPSQVVLRAGDGGLQIESVAVGEQVRAISKVRLIKQLGHLDPESMTAIDAALKIALDLS